MLDSFLNNQTQFYDLKRFNLVTMGVGAVVPGVFFTFVAAILLLFVRMINSYHQPFPHPAQASISSPTWDRISFLNTNANGEETHFGVFGFTGSDTHIGYYFPGNIGWVYFPHPPSQSDINFNLITTVTDD